MKTNRKKITTLSLLISSMFFPIYSYADNPYPHVPLVWQSGTSTIKPNILLFLDSSGSMAWRINRGNVGDQHPESRMMIAKNVIMDVIENTREDNRWGFATFNQLPLLLRGYDANGSASQNNINLQGQWIPLSAQIRMNIVDIDSKTDEGRRNYNQLNRSIWGVRAVGGTPIVGAYYELTRYYRGLSSGYQNLPMPNNKRFYDSPIQYRCQKNYIIFVSDGEPVGAPYRFQLGSLYHNDKQMQELKPKVWQNRFITQRDGRYVYTGMTESIARFIHDNDLVTEGVDQEGHSYQDPDFPVQNIKTFSVGFATDARVLKDIANAGGGQYFQANNGDDLKNALLSSLKAIAKENGYTPATSSIEKNEDRKITSAATTTVNTETWTSELKFHPYNPETNNFDLVNYKVPKYKDGNNLTSRAILSTNNGVFNISKNNIPSSLNNNVFGISPNRTDVQTSTYGVLPISLSNDTNEYKKLLAWLLRWNNTENENGFEQYRDRNKGDNNSLAKYMGDVNSNIISFGDIVVNAENNTDFNRKEFMVIPSNDGMVHILQANTGNDRTEKPYIEKLQYIPGTAQRNTTNDTIIKNLSFTAEKSYGDIRNPKQNFISGNILNIKVHNETSVVGGFGSGARGNYALMIGGKDKNNRNIGLHDIPTNWHNSVPMWDNSTTTFGDINSYYNEFGYNFGLPKVGYISLNRDKWYGNNADVRAAAIVTSGFDNPNKRTPSLMLIDHMGINYGLDKNKETTGNKGKLIRKIEINRSYNANITAENNIEQIINAHDGLTSAQVIDINKDAIVDIAYAADYKGNIWRFDLRDENPNNWYSSMVFEGNGKQPITSEPNLIDWGEGVIGIYFGTGSNLYQSDLNVNSQQSLYGVFDYIDKCKNTSPCRTIRRDDLIKQELEETSYNGIKGYYIKTNNQYSDEKNKKGFYIDLPDEEFKITTTPEVIMVNDGKDAGLVWNIEKIKKTGDNIGASMTCTPAKTKTHGYRLINDAKNGTTQQSISWKTMKSINGNDIVTIPYSGSSSRSILLNNSDSAYREFGKLGSGVLPLNPIDIPRNKSFNCNVEGFISSTTSETGTEISEIICKVPKRIKRLSWREIF